MKELYVNILNQVLEERKIYEKLGRDTRILIIDGLNNFIRIWVVHPATNDDGIHIGGITGFLQTLGVAIRKINPTRVIVVFDGKGGSVKRRKLYPQYKQNRGKGVRLNRAHKWANDEEEHKQMLYQLSRIIKFLKNLPVTLISIDNIEADDTIGYITKSLCNDENQKIYIMSTDKDFYQLIRENVFIWNPINKRVLDIEWILEHFEGIHPSNFILYRAATGDPSDNIQGIKSLGIKTLIKNFPLLKEDTQHSINDMLVYAQNTLGDTRASHLLLDNRIQYELNHTLMILAESNISTSAKLKIIEKFNEKTTYLNRIMVRKLVIQDKLYSVFKDINSWLDNNMSILNSFSIK